MHTTAASWQTLSIRLVARASALSLLFFVAVTLFCGCIRELPGETPPAQARLYYPGRMALSQDGNTAFVVNLNFDQRFNVSWLTSVDVPTLIERATQNSDLAQALTQGLHVPSLGGDLAFAPNQPRAYLTHRGSGLLTVMDTATDSLGRTVLSCGTPTGSDALGHDEAHTDCDLNHLMRLKKTVLQVDGSTTDPNHRQYDDPYALTTLGGEGNTTALLVGYLAAGRISALVDGGMGLPEVQGYIKTPARGISRLTATQQGMVFAASKAHPYRSLDGQSAVSHVVAINLKDPNTGALALQPLLGSGGALGESFDLSTALGGQSMGQPSGISGLVTKPDDGGKLLILSQHPDAVTLVDVSRPPQTSRLKDGSVTVTYPDLSFAVMDAATVADSTLSDVVYVPRGSTELAVVTSLNEDALYFFDLSFADVQLVHRLTLPNGKGPVGLLHVSQKGKDYLLVSTFFDHGLTVIDISATTYTDFTVIGSFHDDAFAVAPRVR